MAFQELILDRYRIIGRAGAGGYATVQHAYDTHLKRDVAIKCIKISQGYMSPAAARVNPPSAVARQQPGAPQGAPVTSAIKPSANDADAKSGFVPLSDKISEPGFLSKREKMAERRAKRKRLPFLRTENHTGDTEDFVAPSHTLALDERHHPIDNEIQIPDFIAAKDPMPVAPNAASRSVHKGRIDPYAARGIAPGASTGSEAHTVDIMRLAGELPGKISGAGETSISSIDDAVIDLDAELLNDGDSIEDESEAVSEKIEAIDEAEDEDEEEEKLPSALGIISVPHTAKGDPRLQPLPNLTQNLTPFANFVNANAEAAQAAQGAVPMSVRDLATADHIPGLEEARTAAHLNDANIVTVYDCVISGDTAYVIMEYVEGKTLARIMRDIGNDITLDMIATVFSSVSHALEVAHNANVLHLDIKPENVIVNQDGIVKVTDFGLSTLMDASGNGTTGGGTIGYMPLEQMRQQPLDVRTDEWALASLTYEMLSGRNPFKARTLPDAERAIEGAELVIPSLCWEDIDESVDDIMFDALSPEMDGRYDSIKDFSEDLAPILGDPKEGTQQLAAAVKDELKEPEEEERPQEPRTPSVPMIDRLGPRGASIAMRIFAALGALMVGAISCLNFRVVFGSAANYSSPSFSSNGSLAANFSSSVDTMFGLFSTVPLAAGIVLAILAALSAFKPKAGFPFVYGVFAVMLFFNQAWASGFLILLAAGAWWWFFGRHSDEMCTLVMLQPLFGSVGFAALVPVLAGALLDIRDALMTTLMAVIGAFVFASLGSDDVMNWAVYANFVVAVNPAIAGAFITDSLANALMNPVDWCVVASWICGSILFSLMCRKGTKAFDVAGSLVCAACLMAGVLILPLSSIMLVQVTPLQLAGAAVPACIGIILAVTNVTDRVRMAEGEW